MTGTSTMMVLRLLSSTLEEKLLEVASSFPAPLATIFTLLIRFTSGLWDKVDSITAGYEESQPLTLLFTYLIIIILVLTLSSFIRFLCQPTSATLIMRITTSMVLLHFIILLASDYVYRRDNEPKVAALKTMVLARQMFETYVQAYIAVFG